MIFTAKVIYSPEQERARAIFSAFINFFKSGEQCEAFVSELRERLAAVIEEQDRVAQQLVDAKQKIATIKWVADMHTCVSESAERSQGETSRRRTKMRATTTREHFHD